MNVVFPELNTVAEVREVFDEQRLKREWDEACADEANAVDRKAAVLRAAHARWPKVPSANPVQRARGIMAYHPELRRFVRDVLGMPDQKNGGMNYFAGQLIRNGADGVRARAAASNAATSGVGRKLRPAVVELVTKYRLGADPAECMEALAKYYEEVTRGQA